MASNQSDTASEQNGGSMAAELNKPRSFFTTIGVVGAIGLIAAGALGGAGSTQANGVHLPAWGLVLQSYIYGYFFWLVLALGCLGVQVLANCIRPTWAMAFLRVAEAGARTLRLLFFLGLPLIGALWFGGQLGYYLYPWSSPEAMAHDPIVVHKLAYLNPGAVTFRYILFFAIWIYYNWYFSEGPKGTLTQDKSPTFDNRLAQDRVNVAAPGIVVYVLTMTFFFTDMVMSLDPHWFSTIYGFWWCVVAAGAAIAMGAIFLTSLGNTKPFNTIVTPALTKDVGNMMLTTTMVYAYFSVSQVLIYWSGNLPEDVSFYYARFKGPLATLGGMIVLCQFFLPFLWLIAGKTKRRADLLRLVAIWILCVRAIDIWYQIEPFFGRTLNDGLAIAVDLAAWAFVGGIWVALFLAEFKKYPVLLAHDQRLQEAKANAGHH